MTGRVRLSQILRLFGWIGLTSLGGGRSVYFHDGLVVRRKWITNHEFIQDLTLSQLTPGPKGPLALPMEGRVKAQIAQATADSSSRMI